MVGTITALALVYTASFQRQVQRRSARVHRNGMLGIDVVRERRFEVASSLPRRQPATAQGLYYLSDFIFADRSSVVGNLHHESVAPSLAPGASLPSFFALPNPM